MSAAVEELTVSVSHVSDGSQASERLARDTGRVAQDSEQSIQEVVNEIGKIATDVQLSASKISDLREKSNRIYDVVNVIREVAEQTNLLALNAAIEAARAGEQGRGFAVVADEVRKLAERTANSTMEISQIIDSIRDGVSDATQTITQSNVSMAKGVDLAKTALGSISTISQQTSLVMAAAQDIANALREQSVASSGIARSVEQIAQMAEQNSAATHSMAGSAKSLDQLAHDLNESVGRFRV
jgi:methyl-accepting chemotaxis protein